jgi:PAS domain S-box-containing protein
MPQTVGSKAELLAQNRDLQARLQTAEETLVAIRSGEIDALVVTGPRGVQVFTLPGADHSFRVLVETMSEGALTVAPNSMILYSNPRFAQMIGQPAEKVAGSYFADYVVEADQSLLHGLIREGLTGTSHGALHLVTTDGRNVPVYFASSQMGMDGNDPVALCIVITDLTQQERNDAIIASERLARSILEQAGEVIIVCDPDGMVIRASRQAFKLCDTNPLRRQFAAAFPLWVQGPPDQPETHSNSDRSEHPLSLSSVADGDQVLAVKGRLHRTDHDVPVLASAVSLRGDVDELLGFVVTMIDVSQLDDAIKELGAVGKQLEQKSQALEITNKHKSDFLANVSHELRTPLNAILGFSEVFLDHVDLPEEQRVRFIQHIHDSGKHLLALINDILDLSKVEAGRMELALEPVPLGDMLDGCVAVIEAVARQKRIRLEARCDPAEAVIVGDPARLKQVVYNLLSNAVKFTPEGGRVSVAAHVGSTEAVFSVRDTGVGIKTEDQTLIFEEFHQGDVGRAHPEVGTGLGLALVRRLVEAHGGTVGVESTCGEGSCFTVTLPLTASPPTALAAAGSAGLVRGLAAASGLAPAALGRGRGHAGQAV